MENYAKGRTLCQAEVQLMDNVSKDLRDGCDSMVGSPGNRKTISRNCFQHPQIDIPRILDAVATEVKSGRMAGPFPVGYIKDAKVNGFLSIIKPGGARRQVGNLAAPKGASFNDGISKESLQEWQVVMTTSQQTSDMIANSGKGSILSCSDMVAAYKCLPVKEQRRLQVFRLLGREFIDLRLIFGDKRACLLYDRFHHCIITMLVLPEAPIPCSWLGRTIDDVTTVAPKEGRHLTERFVDTYRRTLDSLNIGAAEEDINRNKAFDSSTSGEILGIWFDTNQMTWELPKRKLTPLLQLLQDVLSQGKMTLNTVEVLHGKLNHIAPLAPPLKLYMGELVQQLREFLKYQEEERDPGTRYKAEFEISATLVADLQVVLAILKDTQHRPLPIVQQKTFPGLWAVNVYTDISGHIIASPSLGIYSPAQSRERALVASVAFPGQFLTGKDELGKKVFCKTTALEALGVLTALCLDPLRFIGQEVRFINDNVSTVKAFSRGYSKDPWTTTIVRASRELAATLRSSVYVEWERRRSSQGSEIADSLTHNLLEELSDAELDSYLAFGVTSFPQPVLDWMGRPGADRSLGANVIVWIRKRYPALSVMLK